jgi:hypothetical protein
MGWHVRGRLLWALSLHAMAMLHRSNFFASIVPTTKSINRKTQSNGVTITKTNAP